MGIDPADYVVRPPPPFSLYLTHFSQDVGLKPSVLIPVDGLYLYQGRSTCNTPGQFQVSVKDGKMGRVWKNESLASDV